MYLVARDPLGRGEPAAAIIALDKNGLQYRYRRILLPLLAGGFGTFNGIATLTLMIGLTAVGIGLAALGIADLAFQRNVAGTAAIIAMANAGALVSTMLLTVDALALGLALVGISLMLRGHVHTAAMTFAAASLTKEVYVLVPAGLAVWAWRQHLPRQISALSLSAIPLIAWVIWLRLVFPNSAMTGAGNIGVPFLGMIEGFGTWMRAEREITEVVLALFAGAAFLLAVIAVALRPHDPLWYAMTPWVLLAICSTLLVWGKPNNAARAFAILWPLAILQLAPTSRSGESV